MGQDIQKQDGRRQYEQVNQDAADEQKLIKQQEAKEQTIRQEAIKQEAIKQEAIKQEVKKRESADRWGDNKYQNDFVNYQLQKLQGLKDAYSIYKCILSLCFATCEIPKLEESITDRIYNNLPEFYKNIKDCKAKINYCIKNAEKLERSRSDRSCLDNSNLRNDMYDIGKRDLARARIAAYSDTYRPSILMVEREQGDVVYNFIQRVVESAAYCENNNDYYYKYHFLSLVFAVRDEHVASLVDLECGAAGSIDVWVLARALGRYTVINNKRKTIMSDMYGIMNTTDIATYPPPSTD